MKSDSASGGDADARRFYLTVRECRAQIVHEEISAHPELYACADDILHSRRFGYWSEDVVRQAIADLVHDGRLSDAADGRLCVRPLGRAAA